MADLKISELPPLAGALLGALDPLAIADLSASETKKVTAKDLVQYGVALIDDGSIPTSKLNFVIPPGSVGTTELADDAVTAAKLADNSSGIVQAGLPATGAFIGQLAVNGIDSKAYIWNGGSWVAFKSAGSINTIAYNNTTSPIDIGGIQAGDTVTLAVVPKATTSAGQFLAGPALTAGAVAQRSIISTDLPTAGSSKGAVAVNGNGLAMSGDNIVIANTVTASNIRSVVEYDANGLVTAGGPLVPSDLPLATSGSPGIVRPGTGLSVDLSGALNHSNNVVAGTGTKVNFDANGHIISTAPLLAADIPELDAARITSGLLPPARIGDDSITAQMLADYSIAYIQEAEPVTVDPGSIGMLWFQESTASLRMWNGNSWFPVGLGRLAQDNLRWGGLFDASTGLVTGVTNFGLQAGLTVGGPILSATDSLGGLYLVCAVAGSNVSETPGITYDPGDWILCVNQTNGWVRIDTLNSGGGGGGADFLTDLLDVTISNPQNNQVLTFNSIAGEWRNATYTPPVLSVFGRTGAVVAAEGDYTLDLLGDVALTTPAADNVLRFNGTQWVNVVSTAAATPSTLMARDANGSTAVNVMTATVFNIDALPALP